MRSPTPMRTPSRLVLAARAALFAACGACTTRPPAAPVAPPKPVEATSVEKTASSKVTLKLNPAWATCHSGFVPAGEQPAAVASALALTCGAVTHFHKVGEAFAGSQAAAAAPQAYRWSAKAGHCYRAYGAGAPSIKTMDVFIKDSAGRRRRDGRGEYRRWVWRLRCGALGRLRGRASVTRGGARRSGPSGRRGAPGRSRRRCR
jgi:hypothetical protein